MTTLEVALLDTARRPVDAAIRGVLVDAGYCLKTFVETESLFQHLRGGGSDAILLSMPATDDPHGLVKDVRKLSTEPLVVLNVEGSYDEALDLLDLGASDYVCRDVLDGDSAALRELQTRLGASIRLSGRGDVDSSELITLGDVEIDTRKHIVRRGADAIELTRTEYRLLLELARRAGEVVPHEDLLRLVWSEGQSDRVHYLRIYVSRLRKKLGWDGARPLSPQIRSVRSVGYRLETSAFKVA